MKKNIIAILFILTFCGCNTNDDSNRYIVISTGGTDGMAPAILDTKTKIVYSFYNQMNSMEIFKKSLDDAKNAH